MTPDEVNHSQAGNVFMLGAGGVIGEPSVILEYLLADTSRTRLTRCSPSQPSCSQHTLVVFL